MVAFFLLTLFLPLRAPAADVPLPLRKPEGYSYVEACAMPQNARFVEKSKRAKKFLQGFSRKAGQPLQVYSCFRSQEAQEEILRRNKCAPRYGEVPCAGRIAAEISEHSIGAAADFRVQAKVSSRAPVPEQQAEIKRICRLMNQVRRDFADGKGGITVYGLESRGMAYLHYDPKNDWCNWGKYCEQELGEGHCRRTKFRAKQAELHAQLNAAKIAQARDVVNRLEAALARLKADCKPGDAKCRDSFKQ
jgi:hypothetical protein